MKTYHKWCNKESRSLVGHEEGYAEIKYGRKPMYNQ